MKRFFFVLILLLSTMSLSAASVHYFTYQQQSRVVSFLNAQNEIMIYCGYEHELETYVLLNDVWSERVNSRYYEIWIYGYDAYTGEEIFMPIDLDCVWLLRGRSIDNAARLLRFRWDYYMPTIVWTMPRYNHYVRIHHPAHYAVTYHYDVHRYGWMPPVIHHTVGAPEVYVHPYYNRHVTEPVPIITKAYTPGKDKPVIEAPSNKLKSTTSRPAPMDNPRVGTVSAGTSNNGVRTTTTRPTSSNGNDKKVTSTTNNNDVTRPSNNGVSAGTTSRPGTTVNTSSNTNAKSNGNSAPLSGTTTKGTSAPVAKTTTTTSRPTTTNSNKAVKSSNTTTTTTTRSNNTRTSAGTTSRPTSSTTRPTTTTTKSNSNSKSGSSSPKSSSSSRPTSSTSRPR